MEKINYHNQCITFIVSEDLIHQTPIEEITVKHIVYQTAFKDIKFEIEINHYEENKQKFAKLLNELSELKPCYKHLKVGLILKEACLIPGQYDFVKIDFECPLKDLLRIFHHYKAKSVYTLSMYESIETVKTYYHVLSGLGIDIELKDMHNINDVVDLMDFYIEDRVNHAHITNLKVLADSLKKKRIIYYTPYRVALKTFKQENYNKYYVEQKKECLTCHLYKQCKGVYATEIDPTDCMTYKRILLELFNRKGEQ